MIKRDRAIYQIKHDRARQRVMHTLYLLLRRTLPL